MIDWQPVVPLRRKGLPPFGVRRSRGGRRSGAAFVFVEMPVLVLIALAVTFVLKTFVAQAFVIPSESMTPTLNVGDRVVVSRVAYHLHEPRRGDVVVFPNPQETVRDTSALPVKLFHEVLEGIGIRKPSEQELIKRVIGLPGEVVEARGGRVFVDGRPLVEPYLPEGTFTTDFNGVTVPEGFVWVMGDNRPNSKDSRTFGPVEQSTIVGRALFRVWPPGRVAFL